MYFRPDTVLVAADVGFGLEMDTEEIESDLRVEGKTRIGDIHQTR